MLQQQDLRTRALRFHQLAQRMALPSDAQRLHEEAEMLEQQADELEAKTGAARL